MEEKRHHPRMPVDYDYFLTCEGHSYSGKSADVSPFGIGIAIDKFVKPTSAVDLRIIVSGVNLRLETKGVIRHCQELSDGGSRPNYRAGIEFIDTPEMGLPLITISDQLSSHNPHHAISVNATVEKCYQLLSDFEKYPKWTTGVSGAKILDRYPDGRARRVQFEYNFYLRKFHYVLVYAYDDQNNTLSWTSEAADDAIVDVKGSYGFKPMSGDRCVATFDLNLTLGFIPSQRLVKFGATIVMRKEMKNFKEFVEKQ